MIIPKVNVSCVYLSFMCIPKVLNTGYSLPTQDWSIKLQGHFCHEPNLAQETRPQARHDTPIHVSQNLLEAHPEITSFFVARRATKDRTVRKNLSERQTV